MPMTLPNAPAPRLPGRWIAVAIAAVAVVGAGVGVAWRSSTSRSTAREAAHPPALALTDAHCPERPAHARHAAHAALHVAHARMQRYPFAPGDGRLALERLGSAVECARLTGDAALIEAAEQQLARVRARIERDARDHLRRYQLLKARGRLREAAADVAYLTDIGWPAHGTLADQLRRDREAIAHEVRR